MTPSTTIEKISVEEIKETLRDFALRHFNTSLEGLLKMAASGELEPCDDAEILTLIAMLGADEAGQAA